jgi:isoquinoline 1-oxidoreductase alpha subunit
MPQCGYCQSGTIMSATGLLAKKKNPSDADIDAAMVMSAAACHMRIRAAIHEAAKTLT